ncbi:Cyclic AMP receptor protein [subsurface metagenome]|nr:cyclic nucleotide-binding domain-containing protein [bacterium]TET22163.1 MAG: Crp/Fnr family transcriptional regulator [Candidatus Stahlbacteria bacterium]
MWEKKPRYERQLMPGEVLFHEGDTGEVMYFIRKGKIKISVGEEDQEKVFAVLKEGDFFGEMAVIDGSPRSASATAIEETDLIIIDKESFISKINENPLVAYVIETLTKRIRILDEQLKYLTIKSDEERIIHFILARAKQQGTPMDEGVSLDEISTETITHITGVDIKKVAEYLKRLEDVELIKVGDDEIIVRSIPDLDEYIRYLKLRDKFKK